LTTHSPRFLLFRTLAWIALVAVFIWGAAQWWFIGDDAYISFRYAQSLEQGLGLVWQAGERVEGFTNLLWVLLTAAGMSLGFAPETVVHALGLLSGVSILAFLVWLDDEARGPRWWALAAPAWLLAHRSFLAWTTGGLATQFFAMLVLGGVLATVLEFRRGDHRPSASLLFLSLAILTRPEGAIYAALIGVYRLVRSLRGSSPWAATFRYGIPLVAVLVALTSFRLIYYGDYVPNTAHAKVNGAWVSQGLAYLNLHHQDTSAYFYGWLAFLPILRKRDPATVISTLIVSTHLAYVLYVGGDRFDFRFLVFVLPLFAWLMADGLATLTGWIAKAPAVRWGLATAGLAGITTLTAQSWWPGAGLIRSEVESIRFIGSFAERRAEQGKTLHRWTQEGVLPSDLRLCVGAAGAMPYFAELWALDYFGLTHPEIAKRPVVDKKVVAHQHQATIDDLIDEQVDVYDAVGWIITKKKKEATKAWGKQAKKHRRIDPEGRLTPYCLEIDGRYVTFLSPHGPEALEARIGTFPSCSWAQPGR